METASRDEAAVQVHDRAVRVVQHLDAELENPTLGPVPCEDPEGNPSRSGVFYMSGTHQLIVGAGRLAETLRSLESFFTDQGFTVRELRWLDDGTGILKVSEPGGFEYSLMPTDPPVGFAFFVDSPCYQAPEGEDPMDGRWHPPAELTWGG